SEPEDLPSAQALPHSVRRIALEDPEMLLEHPGQGPVRRLPVRQAPPRALQRLRRLVGEPPPELPREAGLGDPRIAQYRRQVWVPAGQRAPVRRLKKLDFRSAADEGGWRADHTPRTHQRQ